MLEGTQRLLEGPHRLAVCRLRLAFSPACRQYASALSHLAPQALMG